MTGMRVAITSIAVLALLAVPAPGFAAPKNLAAKGEAGPLTGPKKMDPVDIAVAHVTANLGSLELEATDVAEFEVSNSYASSKNGVTHVYLQQKHAGIPVLNGILNVNVLRDGRILNVGNRWVSNLAGRGLAAEPQISPVDAVQIAANDRDLRARAPFEILESLETDDRAVTVSGSGVSNRPIPVALRWVPARDGSVRLAWNLGIDEMGGMHYWQMQVDAMDGTVLKRTDLVENAEYRVFPMVRGSDGTPVESPNHSDIVTPADGRELHVGPEDIFPTGSCPAPPCASPGGWHSSTFTEGPNVLAHSDLDADDVPDLPRPDCGVGFSCDFPVNLNLGPATYLDAVIANLFYWNNILHDIHYYYGFDIASGNFEGTDAVLADAQDGSGTNNANFLTLPDGTPPRMQMFIWTPPAELFIAAGAAAGNYEAGSAGYGTPLDSTGITATMELVNDGSAIPSEGCTALIGFTPGNIAVMDRGSCEFGTKSLNAENAGAVGAIIVNNQGNGTISLGPGVDGGSVTIPTVSIGQDKGDIVKPALPEIGTIRAVPLPARDSDFDNGVIAHEYGHGVSNRLTGGAAQFLCLTDNQAGGMGEGWSDWHAIAVFDRGIDVPNSGLAGRGVGTYVSYQATTGGGIRQFPYSTDIDANPLIYSNISGVSIPHGAGTIWASALNEVYWNLIDKHGYDHDKYRGTGGNNLAMQLVMDGMKLHPCNPSFLDARDGILAADLALNPTAGPIPSDNYCEIWEGFAKRGMGVLSDDGGSAGSLAVTDSFYPPLACLGVAIVVQDDESLTAEDTPVAIDVLANDLGDGIFVSAKTNGSFGSVAIDGGGTGVTYTPNPGFVGADTFTYTAEETGGASDSATVTVEVECAGSGLSFADTFDPAPQAGWDVETPVNDDVTPVWSVTADPSAPSLPNVYLTAAANFLKDDRLTAPAQPISATSRLIFEHRYDLESGFDGGVLEVSLDGGIFNDIVAAGGVFLAGGYDSVIDTGFESPIAGRDAWSGNSATFVTTEVHLGAFAGQSAQFRWRHGSDNGVLVPGVLGWAIDDVQITALDDGTECGPTTCSIALPLFADAFETGDASEWDLARNPQGDMTFGNLGLEGFFGMEIAVDHSNVRTQRHHYVVKTHADTDTYCWSFLFDPNSISIPAGKFIRIWGAQGDNNRRLLEMAIRNIGGEYHVAVQTIKDGGIAAGVPFFQIGDGPVLLGGEWSNSAAGGVLKMFVNGAETPGSQTGIVNVSRQLRTPGMGNLGQFRKGTLGSMYFDNFAGGAVAAP